jgi:hypothetical protein
MAPSLYRDGRYRTDVAAAGKVYRQYRGRGRPRYKVQKKQNRPKDNALGDRAAAIASIQRALEIELSSTCSQRF